MPNLTTTRLCEAVGDYVGRAQGVSFIQVIENIEDGIPATPVVQVYPEAWEPRTETERKSFGGGVRDYDTTVHVDVYVQQRNFLGQNLKDCVEVADAITAVFEEQKRKPYFGEAQIKAFHWRAERVSFEWSGQRYAGIRIVMDFMTF